MQQLQERYDVFEVALVTLTHPQVELENVTFLEVTFVPFTVQLQL
jgi:hypothetical protein